MFQGGTQLKNWVDRDVEGVCSLLAVLKGVAPAILADYKKCVRENNISGLVLQNCDIEELRPILAMRFGDWQLFKAAILSLREWDGCLISSEPATAQTANNSSSLSVASTSGGARAKDSVGPLAAGRDGVAKFQQGRASAAKGRRMRRNDSIVQQLSYEAAILHEALEEFSEDSDGDGADADADADDLSQQGAAAGGGSASGDALKAVDQLSPSAGLDSNNAALRLSNWITVLDAPRDVNGDSGGPRPSGSADPEPSPFFLKSTFPSDAQLPMSFGGEGAADKSLDANNSHQDSHGHQHHQFLHSLSSGLEKIARPIIHAFVHSPHHDQHHRSHGGEEEGEVSTDGIALMTMPPEAAAGAVATLPVENPVAAGVTSSWDRDVFSPAIQPPASVSQAEVTLEAAPSSPRPVFSLGSEHSSPNRPTFTLESETSDPARSEMAEEAGQRGSAPWQSPSVSQASTSASASASLQHRSEASQREGGGGPAKDHESFV